MSYAESPHRFTQYMNHYKAAGDCYLDVVNWEKKISSSAVSLVAVIVHSFFNYERSHSLRPVILADLLHGTGSQYEK